MTDRFPDDPTDANETRSLVRDLADERHIADRRSSGVQSINKKLSDVNFIFRDLSHIVRQQVRNTVTEISLN